MHIEFPTQGLPAWPRSIRLFLVGFLFLLTSAVSIGLVFLFTMTSFLPSETIEHYNGSQATDEDIFAEPEKYGKPVSELLLTTHNHLFGFSFIFLILGGLFYFNTSITGRLKSFILFEPFISTWLTFAAIWGIKYINTGFIYVSVFAAVLTYLSYFLIVGILIYELIFKNAR